MKTEVATVLDFNIELTNIPTTLAEAVQLAGSEDEVLNNHIKYVQFHSHNTLIRDELVELLEVRTAEKRVREKDGEKEVVTEKDTAYLKRLRSECADLITDELKEEIRTKWSEIDWTPGKRGSGKLAKEWLAVYDQLKAINKLDEFVSKHNLTLVGELDVDKKIVGMKAKELIDAQARAAKAALLG